MLVYSIYSGDLSENARCGSAAAVFKAIDWVESSWVKEMPSSLPVTLLSTPRVLLDLLAVPKSVSC